MIQKFSPTSFKYVASVRQIVINKAQRKCSWEYLQQLVLETLQVWGRDCATLSKTRESGSQIDHNKRQWV